MSKEAAEDLDIQLKNPEADANRAFSEYVQAVAFQMSLSKAMIAELHVIRDWGYPRSFPKRGENVALSKAEAERDFAEYRKWNSTYPREMRHAMTHRPALERRGLAYSVEPKLGERAWHLTRAGALTCELLVEAGLLPAAPRKRRSA